MWVNYMRRRLGLLAVFFVAALGSFGASCGPGTPECDKGYSLTCPPPVNRNALLQAKRYISEFDGTRARAVYLKTNEDYKKYHGGRNLCEATYGMVLADSQVIIEQLNGLVLRLLMGTLAPQAPALRPAALGGVKDRYRPAVGAYDYGILAENVWTSFEPYLLELSAYAAAVTTIPDCRFSIGVGDNEPALEPGKDSPFFFPLNIGDSKLPVAQIVFQGRFDGAEARALEGLMRLIIASADYVLAHDLSLTIDVGKIAYLAGVPIECIKDDVLGCGTKVLSGEISSTPANLLDAAFIFDENPKLLGKSLKAPDGCNADNPNAANACTPQSNRWERRMPEVHRELARAFFALRSFFPALVARSVALKGSITNEKTFKEYIILYRDANENSKIDSQDDFGLNIKKINLSCKFFVAKLGLTQAQTDKCNQQFSDLQDAANSVLLPALPNLFNPTEASIAELQTFIERMYGNTGGVDDPSITAERIPINSFNAVIREFISLAAILNADTPNFMEFDVKAFFTDPKPVRDFMPYWSKVTDSFTLTRFITDSDTYRAHYFDPLTGDTSYVYHTAGELVFDPRYKKYTYKVNSSGTVETFTTDIKPDWTFVTERPLFQTTYDGGILGDLTNLAVPADCLNGKNLSVTLGIDGKATKISEPVFYFSLPDPTLNTLIYTNLDEWKILYDNNGNGADRFTNPAPYPAYSCSLDPAGFQAATNYTLTKSNWLYLDFLVDHFFATQFAQLILDTLSIPY
jgi:hypothetical protein